MTFLIKLYRRHFISIYNYSNKIFIPKRIKGKSVEGIPESLKILKIWQVSSKTYYKMPNI